MLERPALGGADVIKHRPGGGRGGRLSGQPEAFEREHAKMVFEQGNGVLGRKDPVFERGFSPLRAHAAVFPGVLKQRRSRWIDQLARPQLGQFLRHPPRRLRPLKLGGAELSGRKIKRGKAGRPVDLGQRRQKIVFFRVERVGRGTGRHHPRHLAPHQFLGQARVFHLLAHRHLVAFAD